MRCAGLCLHVHAHANCDRANVTVDATEVLWLPWLVLSLRSPSLSLPLSPVLPVSVSLFGKGGQLCNNVKQ